MKKLFLVFLTIQLTSCEKNKEEQMFYNFMDELTIKKVNMSVKDLDFKIIVLNKTGVVYAKDSLDLLSKNISELKEALEEDDIFIQQNIEEKKEAELDKIETTKFISKTTDPTLRVLNKQKLDIVQKKIDLYQESIDLKMKYSKQRKLSLDKTTSRLEELKRDPNMVIANKYELKYSMHMPDTDITNTFMGFAYTNPENSRFLRIIE